MLETIKKYLRLDKKEYKVNYLYEGNLIETYEGVWNKPELKVICVSKKKKIIYYKDFLKEEINFIAPNIWKSYMTIFKTTARNKNIIIKQLGEMCGNSSRYAPIVFFDNNCILFFPQLRYQSAYLLNNIISKYFNDESFCTIYGYKEFITI